MHIRSRRPRRNPQPLAPLAQRCPELAALLHQLVKQVIVSDDVPEAYLRQLYGLPDDQPVWSRADAVRRGDG